jgi:hypothetical protein
MNTKSKIADMSTNMSTIVFQGQFRLIGTRKSLNTHFQDARIFGFSFMTVHCGATGACQRLRVDLCWHVGIRACALGWFSTTNLLFSNVVVKFFLYNW